MQLALSFNGAEPMAPRPIRQHDLIQFQTVRKQADALRAQADHIEDEAERQEQHLYERLVTGETVLPGRYRAEVFGGRVYVEDRE